MYWVKDCDSDLIDLAGPGHCILTKNGTVTSKRWAGDGNAIEFVLFRGSDEECGRFRDHLFARLTSHQESVHVID